MIDRIENLTIKVTDLKKVVSFYASAFEYYSKKKRSGELRETLPLSHGFKPSIPQTVPDSRI